jgi:hypothetical protein
MRSLLETKTDQPDAFATIARQQWDILPPPERDLLTSLAFAAYPDPSDINARQMLVRCALVVDHARSQVEQTAMLEAAFAEPAAGDEPAAA